VQGGRNKRSGTGRREKFLNQNIVVESGERKIHDGVAASWERREERSLSFNSGRK